jgi:uncharacterized protein YggE
MMDDTQVQNQQSSIDEALVALNRIAYRLESIEGVSEPRRPRRRRRFTEIAAMLAVVIAGSAIGVALYGDTPAKATTPPPKPTAVTCNSSSPKLTVQGSGQATGTPNLLTLVVEVDVTQSNAQVALEADNAQAAAVEKTLESEGVTAKDLQTSNLSIQPNYSFNNNTTTLTGYSVSNTVTANFNAPFATAGTAIDEITAIAGNHLRIDSLSFSFLDPRTLEDQARTDAVTQAMSHAQSMAAAAGEALGPVCSVTDNTAIQPNLYQSFNAAQDSSAGLSARTPLQAGSQQESDQVTVVFALKKG